MSQQPPPGHYWQTPFVSWCKELPPGWGLFVFHLRTARQRARVVAVVEALRTLAGSGAVALLGGPLAEMPGVFWIAMPPAAAPAAVQRLSWLGYTCAVDQVQPIPAGTAPAEDTARRVSWRGTLVHLRRIYAEDPDQIRNESPDRRAFLLEKDGQPVAIQGYRGDGQKLSRRGLPVADARLLANLVLDPVPKRFLDPFAGAGGVILEAVKRGFAVDSVDIDPILRHGLEALGAQHQVADATRLPFADERFAAIATEPPYHQEFAPQLGAAFREMHRVLAPGGHLAMLCAAWQADLLRAGASQLGLRPFLDANIDRKGLNVTILAWDKILA